ncbi:MAG: hypothetical protein ABI193_10135 [Minicystis sp.]
MPTSMKNDASTYLDGRLQIVLDRDEVRMSHWIESPRIIDMRTGQMILDLQGSLWDLLEVLELPPSIVLRMRKYPGSSAPVELVITPDQPGGVLGGTRLDEASLRAALKSYAG